MPGSFPSTPAAARCGEVPFEAAIKIGRIKDAHSRARRDPDLLRTQSKNKKAAKAHHGSFSPPQPEFNDVVSYDSKWLMDDGVVLEPLRAWIEPWLRYGARRVSTWKKWQRKASQRALNSSEVVYGLRPAGDQSPGAKTDEG